ncbi:MAG: HAMP domain-containing protein, partial [Proteobacteria bacterium]|nr:HAMP domain-containing protein [Pseudomonadota bacterium]
MRHNVSRKLAFALSIAAVISGFATYAVFQDAGPLGFKPLSVIPLLLVNLTILLLLSALIARRLVQLWVERRRGSAGSRLHGRLAALFSVVAVTPTIIIAVFSALFLNFGIHDWFNDRVKTALSTSVFVAEAYMQEHGKSVRGDAAAMVRDLNEVADAYYRNPVFYNRFMTTQVALRRLAEAIVFDPRIGIVARTALSYTLDYREIPTEAIEAARTNDGEPILFVRNSDLVRALIKLRGPGDAFLYVGRSVDPRVIAHVEENRRAVAEYEKAEDDRSFIQVTFVMMFIVVALLLLLAAVWLGLAFANRLVAPIGWLISAADQVRGGTMNVQVPEVRDDDEIGSLIRSFNRMTQQLDVQRGELVEANRQLDLRRRFTEAVLAGVTSGVIGLDAEGNITLPNRSATTLLGVDRDDIAGRPLAIVVPEMGPLLDEVIDRPGRTAERQVNIERAGRQRNLLVRVGAEQAEGRQIGYVVTFDDVTELVAAQRAAAWSEIARRIAHEIKNPLTPIQLSAERLKRKYLKEIKSDPTTFRACTDTIIRHVVDI